MRINLNFALEWFYVFLFSMFLVYIGMATTMNYHLQHPFPYALAASDAFGEIAYAEGIIELGNYKYLPSYFRYGFDNTLGPHMPISNHIVAIFSFASGLPVWDSALIMVFISSILSMLTMYLIIRSFNRNIAIMSLPLAVFLYVKNFNFVYTWGIWDLVMATAFLLASIWILNKLELKFSYVLFAILVSAVALTHISEAIFFLMFAILFFALKAIRKKFSFDELRKFILGGILAVIFSSYYLIIFKFGLGAGGFSSSIKYHAPEWYDAVLSHFGLVQFVLIIGMVISLFMLISKKENTALLLGLFMLFIGFTNFISSFAPRAFQTRYLWPVHLGVLFGVVPYFLLKMFIKKWKLAYSIFISIILTASITSIYYQKSTYQGIMDQYHWDNILWMRENTPKDSEILYFYGDPYTQEAVLWNLKRIPYRVEMADFVNSLNERKVKRMYNIDIAAADDAGLLYRKSLFSFGYHGNEINQSNYFGKQDLCKFDYFVFDKVGQQKVLASYNMLIANELVNSGFIEPVFDNGFVLTLKNNNPGADCIGERSF